MKKYYEKKAKDYLSFLCIELKNRCTGSRDNLESTSFFKDKMKSFGFSSESQEFNCMDMNVRGASLRAGEENFEIFPGPWSLPCNIRASLSPVSTLEELRKTEGEGRIILLKDDITKEQLMPKAFPFYNPEEHRIIYEILEEKKAAAILAATFRNPSLAGGVYPFPFIEDGDFDVPNAYMKDLEGERLAKYKNETIDLRIETERIPSRGFNVMCHKGEGERKILLTAHIDAKKGSPGAIDNGTGIVILLLAGEMLKDYAGGISVEITAFNGEDYYCCPGEIAYLEEFRKEFGNIEFMINMDGVGYHGSNTAFSLYGLPEELQSYVREKFGETEGIMEGPQWYQSDHGMFIQSGVASIALTSEDFMETLSAEITHTEKDSPDIVEYSKLVEAADAICRIIKEYPFQVS